MPTHNMPRSSAVLLIAQVYLFTYSSCSL